MRGEVGKKTSKKRWVIPHFYDVTWLIFEKLCKVTFKSSIVQLNYLITGQYTLVGHALVELDSVFK